MGYHIIKPFFFTYLCDTFSVRLLLTRSHVTGTTKMPDKYRYIYIEGEQKFSISQRKARNGRNPQTGETIKIPARKIPKFSAGVPLKAMVNGKAVAKPAKKTAAKAVKPAKAGKPKKK